MLGWKIEVELFIRINWDELEIFYFSSETREIII